MNQEAALMGERMKTPRAAAIAGILFSLLLIGSMLLLRSSVPADPMGAATEVIRHSVTISLALNMLPFAGIAFLWFIAVMRDRLGELEDRFFATVFLGSGLLFIVMIFSAAAVAAGIISVLQSGSDNLVQSGAYTLARIQVFQAMNIYAMKMAGVFMSSTSTISLRTRIVPRWMAFLGFILALILFLNIGTIQWSPLVFPLWVLMISGYILIANFRGQSKVATEGMGKPKPFA